MPPGDFYNWPLHKLNSTWSVRKLQRLKPPLEEHHSTLLKAAYQRSVMLTVRQQLGAQRRDPITVAHELERAKILDERRRQRIATGESWLSLADVASFLRHWHTPVPDPGILDKELAQLRAILDGRGFASHGGGTPGHLLTLVTTGTQAVDETSETAESWFDAAARRAVPLLSEACRTIMAETVGGTHEHDDAFHAFQSSDDLPANGWGLLEDGFCSLFVAVPDRWVRDVFDPGFALLDDRFILKIDESKQIDDEERPVRVRALRGLPGPAPAGDLDAGRTWMFGVSDAHVRWGGNGASVSWVYDDPQVAFEFYDAWVQAQEAAAAPG